MAANPNSAKMARFLGIVSFVESFFLFIGARAARGTETTEPSLLLLQSGAIVYGVLTLATFCFLAAGRSDEEVAKAGLIWWVASLGSIILQIVVYVSSYL